MSDKELAMMTIDQYSLLQHIKQANGDHENRELDHALKVVIAKLSSLGINVEDITLV